MQVEQFLQRLKPFESKVFINPLTEQEVNTIEAVLKRELPAYYRDFLLNVGLKQDVVKGLFDRVKDFSLLENFLPDNTSQNYFQFGDNDEEACLLLRSDDHSDRTIYVYDGYGDYEIKSLHKTFDDLLEEAIQDLENQQNELPDNSKKYWAVQFAIDCHNATQIINALGEQFTCSLVKGIEKVGKSPAGVESSQGIMNLEGIELPIKKQEYIGWATPSFYFDWKESLADMQTDSFVKKIEKQLKSKGLEVKLVDYGVRNWDEK